MITQFAPLFICALIILLIIVIYGIFPHVKGLHFTSRLICPKYGNTFKYTWVPGGSLSFVIRWFGNRFMRCPQCGQWSWFDIESTRIDSN